MDPITAALILGGGSAIARAIGAGSEAAERKRRFERLLASIEEDRRADIQEGLGILGQRLQSSLASARHAGAARATALGRASEAESFILPAEGQIARATQGSTRELIVGINRAARAQKRSAQYAYASGAPIEPGAADIAGDILEGGASYFANKALIEAAFPKGAETRSLDFSGSDRGSTFPSEDTELAFGNFATRIRRAMQPKLLSPRLGF